MGKVKNLSDEEYAEVVSTLVKMQKQADATLTEEFDRNWWEIRERELCFDRRDQLAKLLESTNKDKMTKMITNIMSASTRRKLSVQVLGNPDGIKIQEQEGGDNAEECEANPNGVFGQVLLKSDTPKDGVTFVTDSEQFLTSLNTRPMHYITRSK